MAITYAEMLTAIHDHLDAALTARGQNYDKLTEGMNDTPAFQVYPESMDPASSDSGTQTFTLRGGVIQETHVIHVDYYARQRAHLGEDMALLVDGVDAIVDALEAAGCPPFGLEGIKNFQWSWSRVLFDYGAVSYVGARFVLRVRTF
jgi:hypothetical protein